MTVPVAWVVGLMTTLEPAAPWRATFESTATAIARASEEEPLFNDENIEESQHKTAALLVAVAWYESHLKPTAKSKNGKWYCLYQIDKRELSDPQKALEDPEVCTRAALKILRSSLKYCAKRPKDEQLAVFMSGSCNKGRLQSRYRMFLARKLLREHPWQPSDPPKPPEQHPEQQESRGATASNLPAGPSLKKALVPSDLRDPSELVWRDWREAKALP